MCSSDLLIGLGLAYGALRLLVVMAPTGLPRIHEIGLNLPVLGFTFGIAIFTSLLIGAIPVMRYAKANSNLSLREGGRGQSQSREQHRTRNALPPSSQRRANSQLLPPPFHAYQQQVGDVRTGN